MNDVEKEKIRSAHNDRLSTLSQLLEDPIHSYFPKLEDTVRDHLTQWVGFDANVRAETTQVEGMIDSLVGIADIITDYLAQLPNKKGWRVLTPSIVRPAWKREYQFQAGSDKPIGFLPRGERQHGYLVYGAFRRPDSKYSDLTILFQMLEPGDDTAEKGLEVHTRIDEEADNVRVEAQGVEVYRVLSGYV